IEIPNNAADFLVTSDKPIIVTQYMEGQDAGGGSGDPAMYLAVATEQYRTDYLFHAPTNYEYSYVNIMAPNGANVPLDGMPVTGFTPIGGTVFGVARVALDNNGDGNHRVTADQAVGISVYGYGQFTSYWYAGGANVSVIN